MFPSRLLACSNSPRHCINSARRRVRFSGSREALSPTQTVSPLLDHAAKLVVLDSNKYDVQPHQALVQIRIFIKKRRTNHCSVEPGHDFLKFNQCLPLEIRLPFQSSSLPRLLFSPNRAEVTIIL